VKPTPRPATLDQVNRVIYARSFSRMLSGSFRVGSFACCLDITGELADIKMRTSVNSSQFNERCVCLMPVDGHERKFLVPRGEPLREARFVRLRGFECIGLQVVAEPGDGRLLSTSFPGLADLLTLAESCPASREMVARGAVFRPYFGRSPWIRFNVGVCEAPRVQARVQRLGSGTAG
jgi:DNA-binding transcriptional MocR family regulator